MTLQDSIRVELPVELPLDAGPLARERSGHLLVLRQVMARGRERRDCARRPNDLGHHGRRHESRRRAQERRHFEQAEADLLGDLGRTQHLGHVAVDDVGAGRLGPRVAGRAKSAAIDICQTGVTALAVRR